MILLGLGGLLCLFLYSNPFAIMPSSFLGRPVSLSGNITLYCPTHDELIAQYEDGCPAHQLTSVKQISRVPNTMPIEGFLADAESKVLVRLAYIFSCH